MRETWPDTDNTTAVGAPTGLAACNVSGMTTYQLFQLPVEHEGKTAQYWPLPKDSLKFLRLQLKNVKVFIIDEILMVSSLNLTYIHLRLQEIFGGDKWFAGKTMLFVGDILQLPPVNGTPVFQQVPNKVVALRLGCIGSVNIWKEAVVYDELTINERQKSDKTYTDILDGVRKGFPSKEAIQLLAERVLDKPVIDKFNELRDEGKTPICLFPTRKACEEVNTQLLATLSTESVALWCTDKIDEAIAPCKWNKRAQERLKQMNKDCNMTAGLEEVIHLAVGARVMLRRNLNTEAGLVNGAIGTVLAIHSCSRVTVKFDNIDEPYDVTRVKTRFCVLKHFYIHRQQFPLILAYAVTIHKSQGLSLDCAIIDLSTQVFGEGMAYVALSRVRSLLGVHLTAFSPTSIMASRTCVEEVNRLRQTYRPDLPSYDLPPKRAGKRKMTGSLDPGSSKKPASEKTVSKGVKRKLTDERAEPPSKRPKTTDQPDLKNAKGKSKQPEQQSKNDPRDFDPRRGGTWNFPYNPLGVEAQQHDCRLLNLTYRQPNSFSRQSQFPPHSTRLEQSA